ncbi:hypothetical protein E1176_08875 [Fulvivirga sp. RKSG066]|uniref:hypothetical protein n=1 Tax=Fulvivirga aurantia TaxID=2529383 RepID=UPI0012BC9075|nr:hypothetical protein [Fulvivirga aurantia]MTI21131.1 hypothetical protein [Fulvivirga aurantia]
MELRKNYLLLLFISILAVSCGDDDAADLLTVTQNGEVSQTLSVATDTQTEFDQTLTIDVASDSDVTQFGDRIDSYEIDSIYIEFDNFVGSPDVNITQATAFILAADDSQILQINIGTPINLKEADDNNGVVVIKDLVDGVESLIIDSITEDGSIKIRMQGAISEAPASFDVEATLYFQVTGSLIN